VNADSTTSTLLAALRDPVNQNAWTRIDAHYRPIIERVARRVGLSESDAADAAQETLLSVTKDFRAGRYTPERGRLRTWILAIARFRIADAQRGRGRHFAAGDSVLATLPAAADIDDLWEEEHRKTIFALAINELRRNSRFSERTLSIYERLALGLQPVREIASEFGVAEQEIYEAKARITGKLREIIAEFDWQV
jgi:RNA polymerase sigma factor (sigma-70 family)